MRGNNNNNYFRNDLAGKLGYEERVHNKQRPRRPLGMDKRISLIITQRTTGTRTRSSCIYFVAHKYNITTTINSKVHFLSDHNISLLARVYCARIYRLQSLLYTYKIIYNIRLYYTQCL